MGCGGVPDPANAKSRRGAPGGRTGALPRGGTSDQFVGTTSVGCQLCWQGGAGAQPLSLRVAGSVHWVEATSIRGATTLVKSAGVGSMKGQIDAGSNPPMRQTSAHSAGVTGCTERREERTSTMFASLRFALTATRLTGFGISASA